jgi:hypothetical protein
MSQQWGERIPVLFAVLGLRQALFNLQMLVWYELLVRSTARIWENKGPFAE